MERIIRNKKTETDLKIPVDASKYPTSDNDCFGEMWDMSSKECPQCADKDLCAILFKGKIDAKAVQIKTDLGLNYYLDETDFDAVTNEKLFEFIISGETTTSDLKDYFSKEAKCDDMVAVIEKLKQWIKSQPNVYTKNGVVWIR